MSKRDMSKRYQSIDRRVQAARERAMIRFVYLKRG
jgi:hypothetical protein